MPDPVTLAQLSALLNESLEVGLGLRLDPSTPGLGFSSPSPHIGGLRQGTFSGGLLKRLLVIRRLFMCRHSQCPRGTQKRTCLVCPLR